MLQLRDEKPDIDFPGYWGLFGGEINVAENPEDAARRELYEEIRYNPTHINLIGKEILPELGGIVVYTYFCSLYTPLNMLSLNEGMDFGLFTMKDIKKRKLYSTKLEGMYPVVPVPYVLEKIQQAICAVGGTYK